MNNVRILMFLLLIAAADTFSGQLLASDVPSTEMLRLSLQGAVRNRCRGQQTPAMDHCYPPFDAEKEFTLTPHCPSLEYYVHQYSFDPIPCNDYGSQVLKHYDPRYHYDHQRTDRTADDEAVVRAFRKWQKEYR